METNSPPTLQWFKADLHIHTVLSPCGDLESSPANIVAAAKALGLQLLGITDHNTLRHTRLVRDLALREGIAVLCGAEVTTQEEAHVLCFFEGDEAIDAFQQYLQQHLPPIPNDVDKFGFQVVLDEEENIIDQEEYLLLSAINQTVEQIEAKTHALGGLFIPAHVDRPSYSLVGQLGFLPDDLLVDALELSHNTTPEKFLSKHSYLSSYAFIQNSDAHYPEHIGKGCMEYYLADATLGELSLALGGLEGRGYRRAMPEVLLAPQV